MSNLPEKFNDKNKLDKPDQQNQYQKSMRDTLIDKSINISISKGTDGLNIHINSTERTQEKIENTKLPAQTPAPSFFPNVTLESLEWESKMQMEAEKLNRKKKVIEDIQRLAFSVAREVQAKTGKVMDGLLGPTQKRLMLSGEVNDINFEEKLSYLVKSINLDSFIEETEKVVLNNRKIAEEYERVQNEIDELMPDKSLKISNSDIFHFKPRDIPKNSFHDYNHYGNEGYLLQ